MERLSGNWDDGTGTDESNWKDCYWDRVMIGDGSRRWRGG